MPENEAVTKSFKSLIDVLDEEVRVYRVMLDLVRREKDILISAKLDELDECNKSKEALVLKIRGLERIREKAARELAVAVGVNSESPRLLDIAV
jgi:flagellar biosynthesis/type III secretory pathway chaperone